MDDQVDLEVRLFSTKTYTLYTEMMTQVQEEQYIPADRADVDRRATTKPQQVSSNKMRVLP